MRTKTNSTTKSVLFILLALVFVTAMIGDSVYARLGNASDSDNQSQKEDNKKKKEKSKSKSRSEDSESEKDSNKASKSQGREHNAAPTVVLTAEGVHSVEATVETEPVPHGGDAADDPAIWVNPSDPALSTIIGTDKQGGLAVYDLSGKQLQYLADGQMDNVDLRDGFKLNGKAVSIVAAGNRRDNSIAIYTVNPQTRLLENAAARKINHGIQIYGTCLYQNRKTSKTYYYGTSKSGDVEQWELFDNGQGRVDARKVRNFKVGTVIEGCVADDEFGQFYVSEEAVGIWKYGAEPESGNQRTLVDKVGNGNLYADVEGLAIAYGRDGTGYLMASSQGNHTFVVYRRDGNNEFVKKFRIGNGSATDGAEETDGIDVTTANLGPAFPYGVFVAQDGFNDKGNQNFKLVPLQLIVK